MKRVRKQIGCENVVQALNGKNITIAVLDTGVAIHPDLQDKVLAFKDFVNGRNIPYDDSGHGTHVCGIASGTGFASEGEYRGIAPGSNLVVGKILDRNGDGIMEDMVEAILWVLAIREQYNIRILNISVGVGKMLNNLKEERLKEKLESAWEKGLLVVCAAGNNGPAKNSLSEIGKSSTLITVGCHDGEYFSEKANRCATYCARGSIYDTVRKPDIVAPGTEIVSCNTDFQENRGKYAHAYVSKSGTSMATPIISGALALLLEKHQEYDNETAKRRLLYSARDLKEPWYVQGWGMLDVENMLKSP